MDWKWWLVTALIGLYGIINSLAGVAQVRLGKIPRWAAVCMCLVGSLQLISAVLILFRFHLSVYVLLAGLLSMHIIAIYNGRALHGKINPVHHVIRALFSVSVLALALSAVDRQL